MSWFDRPKSTISPESIELSAISVAATPSVAISDWPTEFCLKIHRGQSASGERVVAHAGAVDGVVDDRPGVDRIIRHVGALDDLDAKLGSGDRLVCDLDCGDRIDQRIGIGAVQIAAGRAGGHSESSLAAIPTGASVSSVRRIALRREDFPVCRSTWLPAGIVALRPVARALVGHEVVGGVGRFPAPRAARRKTGRPAIRHQRFGGLSNRGRRNHLLQPHDAVARDDRRRSG